MARRNGKVFVTGNSGFPKSLDVSRAIDKALIQSDIDTENQPSGVGDHVGTVDFGMKNRCATCGKPFFSGNPCRCPRVRECATEDAARWAGFGTALKPGQEMWWLARKPLAAGTVAANVLEFGTGALNIDGCKVGTETRVNNAGGMGSLQNVSRVEHGYREHVVMPSGEASEVTGRWPTNIVFTHSAATCEPIGTRRIGGSSHPQRHDSQPSGIFADLKAGSRQYGDASGMETVEAWACADDCPVAELDRQSGHLIGCGGPKKVDSGHTSMFGIGAVARTYEREGGGASRFYPTFRYQAKAPTSERPRLDDGTAHETVKPLGLMRWLVRLITPPGGTVLDLFAGSGPTAEACIIEGFRCVLIEQDPKSAELIKTRLSKPIQPTLFGLEAS